MNSKHENFVRLAESRVNKAIDSLRLVGNLSNRNNYEYNDVEVRAILSALTNAINELKSQFSNSLMSDSKTFKLPNIDEGGMKR